MTETANINIDDVTLVERCRQGDSEAMERLIIKYQNRIYNVILKICANADDAAELSQETFVKVIENIEKFEGRSSFYTWLFRIAVNLTLSYCKRSVKLGLKSLDSEDDERGREGRRALKEFLSDDSLSDPAAIASKKELYELIKKAMMKLDDNQRAVIVLRDIEGMDYAQIAKVLDVELGTVKSRLNRGRSNLREIMEAISQ